MGWQAGTGGSRGRRGGKPRRPQAALLPEKVAPDTTTAASAASRVKTMVEPRDRCLLNWLSSYLFFQSLAKIRR